MKETLQFEIADNFIKDNQVVWISNAKNFFTYYDENWHLYPRLKVEEYIESVTKERYFDLLKDGDPEKVRTALEIISNVFKNGTMVLIRDRVSNKISVFDAGWDKATTLSNEEIVNIRKHRSELRKAREEGENTEEVVEEEVVIQEEEYNEE